VACRSIGHATGTLRAGWRDGARRTGVEPEEDRHRLICPKARDVNAMGAQHRLRRAVALTWIATALLGPVLAGCTSSRPDSSVSGRAILVGRLPGHGQPFTVGAVRNGKVIKTTEVHPGEYFRLAVPPGHYQIGLWVPGARHSVLYMTCVVPTTVKAGHPSRTNLQCVWHGGG
jgi:hypothetical protein